MNWVRIYRLYKKCEARLFTSAIRGAFLEFGKGSIVVPPARIIGESQTAIGRDVYLGRGCWLRTTQTEDNQPGCRIRLGDRVASSGGLTLSAKESIVIEDDVLIAANVYISDHSHNFDLIDVPVASQGTTPAKPVRIRSGAWIGYGAVICPGVTVGRNAVIGANAVVRCDVPDYTIAAGVPARVIRRIGEVNA